MGRAVKICVALAFLAGQRGVAHHPAPAQEASPPEDVVVTARPGAPPPRLDAIGYYRRYCFDANRLTGRSAPPVDDADWEPLDDDLRAKFGLFDSQAPAFSLVDRERGYTLVIKFETFARPGALVENRCTLIVRGGGEHGKLGAAMNALFRVREQSDTSVNAPERQSCPAGGNGCGPPSPTEAQQTGASLRPPAPRGRRGLT